MGLEVTYTCDVCGRVLTAAEQPVTVTINGGDRPGAVVQKIYHVACYATKIKPTLDP